MGREEGEERGGVKVEKGEGGGGKKRVRYLRGFQRRQPNCHWLDSDVIQSQ